MKVAKKYENIDWKQCQIELFRLQNEILKAIKTGNKRNVSRSKNVFLSGQTKSALAKLQKGYCPVCEMILFNGEDLEIHHILLRQKNGDYSLKNLKLLHKLCHK